MFDVLKVNDVKERNRRAYENSKIAQYEADIAYIAMMTDVDIDNSALEAEQE